MSYQFPESLTALRKYLHSQGLTGDSIKTSRQAAFMAQQLLGCRMKFPPQGSDMMSTLLLIQKQIQGGKPVVVKPEPPATDLFGKSPTKGKKGKDAKARPEYLSSFSAEAIASGYHIFADGASVPNPGLGGWGFAAYKDGQEIASDCGGEPEATNNSMELTALLQAIRWALQYPSIAITIWSDSEYSVKGVNEWRHGWKVKGWQRGGDKAEPKNRILLNADLWQAIDAALSGPRAANISVKWVKGHAGHVWNERADALAEMGRQSVADQLAEFAVDDLDQQYRSIMQESA